MADYIATHYKGKYRCLAEIDESKNDFPRDANGNIDQSTGVYIKCANNCQIYAYGTDGHREMQLGAYIPSLGRGRNIKKELQRLGIAFDHYDESSCEVTFTFSSFDIDKVAEIMKARTAGAGISPFSTRNLKKNTVDIPDELTAQYKDAISKLDKSDMLLIKQLNKSFLNDVLAKKLRDKGKRKLFDYAEDMRKIGLKRDTKGYIYAKGLWDEYLSYLDSAIDNYYNDMQ